MGLAPYIRPGVRIEKIAPAWRERQAAVAALATRFGADGTRPGDAELLKVQGSSFVVRTALEGTPVIVKWRELATLRDRASSLLRTSRGFRQWRGSKALARAGIPTARPVALLTQYGLSRAELDAGRKPHSYANPREWLILEAAPGKTALDHLASHDLSVRDQHSLARAVGVQVSAMLRAGLCNRDHKLSNIIVSFEEGVPLVTLIDTVAIRRRGNPGEIVRMLATLLIESIGVHCPPRAPLAYRALRDACAAWLEGTLARPLGAHKGDRKALRALVRSTARRIDQYVTHHGDPTPRVNPLTKHEWPGEGS